MECCLCCPVATQIKKIEQNVFNRNKYVTKIKKLYIKKTKNTKKTKITEMTEIKKNNERKERDQTKQERMYRM